MYCKTTVLSILVVMLACRPVQAEIHCPADVTGNLVVNIDDLLGVIIAFDQICPVACPADTDGNGVVDFDDLLNVINNWGECEMIFILESPLDAEDGGDPESTSYCIYRIDSVGAQPAGTPAGTPQAVTAGQQICIHCPITYMNACPNLANCKFKKRPGVPNAVSGGVNATSIGNGFCQQCPPGNWKYR